MAKLHMVYETSIMLTVDEENYLRRIWTAPKHAGSFTGPEKLYHIVKKERKYKIGVYRIKQFLADQDSHSLQKRVQRKFKRNHIIVQGIDTQCDVDMQNLAKSNDGIQYILVAQDVFSRFVFAVPMKQKTATQTIKALETLFSTGRKPKLLRTDKGTFFKKEGVHIFYTQNETKSSFAERSIQNSKNRLYRMFTESQSYEYIKELPDIVQSINDTPSRPLGNVAPSNVHKNNEDKIRLNAYLVQTKIKLHTKMKIKTHIEINVFVADTTILLNLFHKLCNCLYSINMAKTNTERSKLHREKVRSNVEKHEQAKKETEKGNKRQEIV
ncbi:hypothetical protein KUTeg_021482 [Tegillarca granosa]|uniref:Integrase catalytic domain-containing protein n=1 Tax=Tegillarca granosa TaxID=220873 RepID=A0ABQ9E3E4_TEGGR|nr:hypothetical protein KUTeg_021482 [Tegillarca granosa]